MAKRSKTTLEAVLSIRGKNQIYVSLFYSGKRVIIYTKERIETDLWDSEKKHLKRTIKNPNYKEQFEKLETYRIGLKELFDSFIEKYKREPQPDELKPLFRKKFFDNLRPFETGKQKSLLNTLDEFIEKQKVENSASTARKYIQIKNLIIDFGKKTKKEVQFESITASFQNEFLAFLQNDKNYTTGTIHRYLKFFKTVIFYAIKMGYIGDEPLKTITRLMPDFKLKDYRPYKLALSETELSELENLDLTLNPKLDRVRDRYLLGCYTGLRYSDLSRLSKHHIEDDEFIIIEQKKVSEPLAIPIFDEVRAIFEKYNYELPKAITGQKFNNYLKELGKLCETLQRQQEIKEIKGGKEIFSLKPRWQLLTSHTARRTFVTIAANRGVPLDVIIAITGHTRIETVKDSYLVQTPKEKAKAAKRAFEEAKRKNGFNKSTKVLRMNA